MPNIRLPTRLSLLPTRIMTPRTLVRPDPSLAAPTLCFTLRVTNFSPPFRLRLLVTALWKHPRRPVRCRPLLPTLSPLTQQTNLRLRWPPLQLTSSAPLNVLATCLCTPVICLPLQGLTDPTNCLTPLTPLANPPLRVVFLRPWKLIRRRRVALTARPVVAYLLLDSLRMLMWASMLGTCNKAVN